MRFGLFVALVALLLAAPASGFTYDDCNGNTDARLYTVSRFSLSCIAALPADTTDTLFVSIAAGIRISRLAEALDSINKDRRNIEATMRDQAFAFVDAMDDHALPSCVCLYDERWHQGVVGLIASYNCS